MSQKDLKLLINKPANEKFEDGYSTTVSNQANKGAKKDKFQFIRAAFSPPPSDNDDNASFTSASRLEKVGVASFRRNSRETPKNSTSKKFMSTQSPSIEEDSGLLVKLGIRVEASKSREDENERDRTADHDTQDKSLNRTLTEDRRARYRKLLKKAGLVCYFIGIMRVYMSRVKVYGAIRKVEHLRKFVQEKDNKELKHSFLPLLPESKFKIIWNINILILLIATALILPYLVAFIDDISYGWMITDYFFDAAFTLDIFVNFLSAYQDEKHHIVTSWREIIPHYLKTWFIVDLIACSFPVDIALTHITDYYKDRRESLRQPYLYEFAKFLRVPRLYKILKILRLIKLIELRRSSLSLGRLTKQLNINVHASVGRMIRLLLSVLILNHISACVWFLSAKLNDFNPDTWVSQADLVDAEPVTQYIAAYYWAFQTLTTVGFGDLPPNTDTEKAIAVVWMLIGIAFYSFAIGNLSTIFANLDKGASILRNKVNSLNNFAMRVNLPEFLRVKIQRHTEINHRDNIYSWIDPHDLLKELPSNLRTHLILFSFAKIIRNVRLLKIDANFTAAICPTLKILRLRTSEVLYRMEDPATEVFFITTGMMALVDEDRNEYAKISAGSFIGELELLEGGNFKRKTFAQAADETQLLVCDKSVFLAAIKEFPAIEDEVNSIAARRREAFFERKHPFPDPPPNIAKLLKTTEHFTQAYQQFTKQRGKLFDKPSSNKRLNTIDKMMRRGSVSSSVKNLMLPSAVNNKNALVDAYSKYNSGAISAQSSDSDDSEFVPSDLVEQMLFTRNQISESIQQDLPQDSPLRNRSRGLSISSLKNLQEPTTSQTIPLQEQEINSFNNTKNMQNHIVSGVRARLISLRVNQNHITEQDEGRETDSPLKLKRLGDKNIKLTTES